jgi:hypothetical protein
VLLSSDQKLQISVKPQCDDGIDTRLAGPAALFLYDRFLVAHFFVLQKFQLDRRGLGVNALMPPLHPSFTLSNRANPENIDGSAN